MNSSPLAAIWHWYPLLAWVACARFCSLPLGSLSYLNFYLKLRLDSNFSYGTGLSPVKHGLVGRVADWPFPSFHRYVKAGLLSVDWANSPHQRPGGYG